MAKTKFTQTVAEVDLNRYMKKWYVIAGRTTFFEKNAFNSTETYTWYKNKSHIRITFHCRIGSFFGKEKTVKQKAWVVDRKTHAHWKVRPHFWPIYFHYLILAMDPNYEWVAVGTPNKKFLWIMCETPEMRVDTLQHVLDQLEAMGYPITQIHRVPQEEENEKEIVSPGLIRLKNYQRTKKIKSTPA